METNERVQLVVPARTDFLQLLRLCISGVAADGFGVDEIEDLKIAIEELAAVLITAPDNDAADEALRFVFELGDDRLVVSGHRRVEGKVTLPENEFLATILDAVLDGHAIEAADGELRIRFEKRIRGG